MRDCVSLGMPDGHSQQSSCESIPHHHHRTYLPPIITHPPISQHPSMGLPRSSRSTRRRLAPRYCHTHTLRASAFLSTPADLWFFSRCLRNWASVLTDAFSPLLSGPAVAASFIKSLVASRTCRAASTSLAGGSGAGLPSRCIFNGPWRCTACPVCDSSTVQSPFVQCKCWRRTDTETGAFRTEKCRRFGQTTFVGQSLFDGTGRRALQPTSNKRDIPLRTGRVDVR